ncbi:MAG: hypothetical protein QI197_08065 [Candidatus Korarchaeota archaeon]|nr:hypothetical protein [Candidatus Korarchaeota archaeon]
MLVVRLMNGTSGSLIIYGDWIGEAHPYLRVAGVEIDALYGVAKTNEGRVLVIIASGNFTWTELNLSGLIKVKSIEFAIFGDPRKSVLYIDINDNMERMPSNLEIVGNILRDSNYPEEINLISTENCIIVKKGRWTLPQTILILLISAIIGLITLTSINTIRRMMEKSKPFIVAALLSYLVIFSQFGLSSLREISALIFLLSFIILLLLLISSSWYYH